MHSGIVLPTKDTLNFVLSELYISLNIKFIILLPPVWNKLYSRCKQFPGFLEQIYTKATVTDLKTVPFFITSIWELKTKMDMKRTSLCAEFHTFTECAMRGRNLTRPLEVKPDVSEGPHHVFELQQEREESVVFVQTAVCDDDIHRPVHLQTEPERDYENIASGAEEMNTVGVSWPCSGARDSSASLAREDGRSQGDIVAQTWSEPPARCRRERCTVRPYWEWSSTPAGSAAHRASDHCPAKHTTHEDKHFTQ